MWTFTSGKLGGVRTIMISKYVFFTSCQSFLEILDFYLTNISYFLAKNVREFRSVLWKILLLLPFTSGKLGTKTIRISKYVFYIMSNFCISLLRIFVIFCHQKICANLVLTQLKPCILSTSSFALSLRPWHDCKQAGVLVSRMQNWKRMRNE